MVPVAFVVSIISLASSCAISTMLTWFVYSIRNPNAPQYFRRPVTREEYSPDPLLPQPQPVVTFLGAVLPTLRKKATVLEKQAAFTKMEDQKATQANPYTIDTVEEDFDESSTFAELTNVIHETLLYNVDLNGSGHGIKFAAQDDRWACPTLEMCSHQVTRNSTNKFKITRSILYSGAKPRCRGPT